MGIMDAVGLLAIGLVIVGTDAAAGAAAPRVVALDPAAMGARVIGGEVRIGGQVVRVKDVERLDIEPAEEIAVRDEPIAIADGEINHWIGGTSLPGVLDRRAEVRLWGCLKPGTLVVKSAPDGEPYARGRDYEVDETWGAAVRLPTGRIAEKATVYASYTYGLERLDTVQVDAKGWVSVRRGKSEKICPLPAGAEKGCRAIANIYVSYHAPAISRDLIYPIGPRVKPVISRDPQRYVAHTLRKLRAGGPVTVVFLGDSVTAGGNASSPAYRFPNLFASRLQRMFPRSQVTMINAGVGGSNSDFGLQRLDKDVLAHRPDLVVTEFVNDMGWPREKILHNYAELVRRIRANGETDIIICTPHLMAEFFMGKFDAAAQALRDSAAENGVGLADVSRMWRDLAGQGIPYLTLLANRINHPDNRGHRLFADALIEFFKGTE